MIKHKPAVIGSAILLVICMYLYFPYPDNQLIDATATFMSFPVRNQNGLVMLGILESILFILAMLFLVIGLGKYQFRTILIVILLYTFLPRYLLMVYQDTFASGISAISYDGNGRCEFEDVSEALLEGTCSLMLQNHSKEPVSFELEFLDSNHLEEGVRMESLMNVAGPYRITVDAKQSTLIDLKEILDVSTISGHIFNGSSNGVHIRLTEGDKSRIL
ncbi:hypothetical protein [Sporosarcina sp. Te-1]|uniref:hypothetical protein n=1 Tax=Sporosarcina sp. Te-1 TaxID=2818390 RepID=UPI001A9D0424|nr:hypothetical protein [Sporosarcina sp. Te-1]QTD42076.1 hypothetical protein J3U78_04365 [Sporosarcina sp. Te-1]